MSAPHFLQHGRTALHAAAEKGHLEVAKVLLQAGADMAAQDKVRFTVSTRAACERVEAPRVAAWLMTARTWRAHVRFGVRHSFSARLTKTFFSPRQDGRTPLHKACERGSAAVAHLLIQKGANMEAKDSVRASPRLSPRNHFAPPRPPPQPRRLPSVPHTTHPCPSIPFHPSPQHDRTPLHAASEKGQTEVVKLLAAGGADISLRDRSGKSPLDLCDGDEVKEVLLKIQNGASLVGVLGTPILQLQFPTALLLAPVMRCGTYRFARAIAHRHCTVLASRPRAVWACETPLEQQALDSSTHVEVGFDRPFCLCVPLSVSQSRSQRMRTSAASSRRRRSASPRRRRPAAAPSRLRARRRRT